MSRETIELTAAVHPVFFGEFSAFFRELTEAFREIGFRIRPINRTMDEYVELQHTGEGDLNIGRWNADYPDADNFVHTAAALRTRATSADSSAMPSSTSWPNGGAPKPIRACGTRSTGASRS